MSTGTSLPVIGWIVLLVFMVQDGEAGTNPYGPSPNETFAAEATAVA